MNLKYGLLFLASVFVGFYTYSGFTKWLDGAYPDPCECACAELPDLGTETP